jgi:carbonic anhydrase/acetyltransferase-like protein (isoleucine patch superfamily)
MSAVFVAPTGRQVAPFDEPPGDLLIANRPLAAWRDEAIRDAGLVRIDEPKPPCLVIPDALFTNGVVLRRFVDGAGGRDAVLVLGRSRFADATTPVQPEVEAVEAGWRFHAVRWVSGRGEAPVDVVVDPEEHLHTVKLPALFGGPVPIGLPRHPVLTVHHWVHLLWANQAAEAMIVRRMPAWRGLLRVLWAVLRARSVNPWRVMARLNTIGRRCDIHPTAIVEASTLGDGVTVGPYARVAFSRIGDGATIMSGAEVEASTVGEGATVGQRCGLRMCVVYPDAMASQILMQACLIGRRTLTVPGSYSIDLNLDREIRVMLDGALHSTGTRFLGSAFGHDCRIGTGVWLASGRTIPNGTVLIRDPALVIHRVPEVAPGEGPLVNVSGKLEPVGRGAG